MVLELFMENINIELDEAFLKQFFGLTEKVIPEGQQITLAMLRQQVEYKTCYGWTERRS